MKRSLKLFLIPAILITSLLFTFTASAAADFVTVRTNDSWPTKDRTAGGTVFTSTYTANGYVLKAKKSGKTTTISKYANGGTVISDGTTVYYCTSSSKNLTLYKMNLSTGKNEKIKKLGTSSTWGIDLCGKYKNDIYFIRNVPEGSFWKINLKTKAIKKVSIGDRTVSIAQQTGQYFVLKDGTGAGYSYLGLLNAKTGKFKQIAKWPVTNKNTSKYIYYVQKKDNTYASSYNVSVKRYNLETGKTKTLVSSLKIRNVQELTTKYVKYLDANGNVKTKKW